MAQAGGAVEHAWANGSYRMEVWMTGATAGSLLFLHDKDLLVSGEADGTVRVLYEKTRGPTTVQRAHTGAVTALVLVRTATRRNLFVSAGVDRVIRLWGPDEQTDGHFRVLQDVRVVPGDEQVSGIAEESEVRMPSVRRSALASAADAGDALLCMSGGQRVVVWGPPEDGDAEDRVAVLDVVELRNGPALMKLFDLRGHSGGVKFVACGGDDEIVTLDALDTVRVFSVRSRSLETTTRADKDVAPTTCVLCVRQHSQRMLTPLLLLARDDGTIDVCAWPSAGGARLHLLRRHSGRVTHMQHVGDSLISAGLDSEIPAGGRECVRFSNIATGKLHGSFTTAPVTCMCLRTDSSVGMRALRGSQFALTGHVDGKAILWDVEAQRSLHILDGHHKAVRSVFANRLCAVSGGEDSTCRVWRFVDAFVLRKEEEDIARASRKAKEMADEASKSYRRRRFDEAAARYSEAMQLEPDNLLHVTNRAATYLEAGELHACIADCNYALDAIALRAELGNEGAAEFLRDAEDDVDSAALVTALHDVTQPPPSPTVAVGSNQGDSCDGEGGNDSKAPAHGSGDVSGLRKVYARAHGRKGKALALLGEVEEAVLHLKASLAVDPSQNLVRERLLQLTSLADTHPPALLTPDTPQEPSARWAECEEAGAVRERPGDGEEAAEGHSERGDAASGLGVGGVAPLDEHARRVQADEERRKGGQEYKSRRFESALEHYSKAVRLEPQNALHWANRSAAYFESKNFPACIADCDEALLRARGQEKDQDSSADVDPDAGEKLAALIAKLDARKSNAMRRLDEEALASGPRSGATPRDESAEGKQSGCGDSAGDVASACEQEGSEGNVDEAEEEERKRAADIEKRRGNEMFRGRRYGEAIEYYDKALQLDAAQAPLLLLNRAVAYGERGSYMLAAADFEKALARALEELSTAKSDALIARGDEGDAAAVEAVSRAADGVCKVLTKKGRMLEKKALKGPKADRLRGLRDALKCLHDARKQQPDDTSERPRAALDEAVRSVEERIKGLQLDDEAKEELANGDRMFADGQHAAAIKFYDKAERADPRGERADAYLMYSNRAGCLLELKRYRQALRDAERCVQLRPSWPTGHMLKGRVHESLEEWAEMLTACCSAYDLDPHNETNLAMMRDCLVQHLTNDSLRRRQPGAFSDVLGRAREDESLKRLVQDPQVLQVTTAMQRSRDLSPLVKVLEDLPLAGKLAKLFEVGMLVPGM